MLVQHLGAASLALQGAHAFRDASPFFLFSNNLLDTNSLANTQVASASSVESHVSSILKRCPSNTYVFISQPGAAATDFQSSTHLKTRLSSYGESAIQIPDVVGTVESKSLHDTIEERCRDATETWETWELDGSDGLVPHFEKTPQAITISFPALPAARDQRSSTSRKHDSYLNDVLSSLDSYTVIYTTTPAEGYAQEVQHQEQYYEMDDPYPSGLHTDLKRDLNAYARASKDSNLDYNLPLFEKYQFLSSGIFMGLSVSLLLFMILYVGISAIAGLQVSYQAFSKEMGPAAQKKQQQ